MVAEKKLYRRVSVTQEDGSTVKYDARVDMEADPVTGVVFYKVYSQVLTDRFVPLRGSTNPAEDTIRLESVCQRVYEFDQSYRVRAVPKPTSGMARPKIVLSQCPLCGGSGFTVDEWGYEDVCVCRR